MGTEGKDKEEEGEGVSETHNSVRCSDSHVKIFISHSTKGVFLEMGCTRQKCKTVKPPAFHGKGQFSAVPT